MTFKKFEFIERIGAKSEYEKQAIDFACKHDVKLYVADMTYGKYFPDDTDKRWIFSMRIERNKKNYQFTFGQSIADAAKTPTYYDVLAALKKYDPGTFEDFCAEFGYNNDSRKAEQTYKAVKKEYAAVERLFGDILDELREIQ